VELRECIIINFVTAVIWPCICLFITCYQRAWPLSIWCVQFPPGLWSFYPQSAITNSPVRVCLHVYRWRGTVKWKLTCVTSTGPNPPLVSFSLSSASYSSTSCRAASSRSAMPASQECSVDEPRLRLATVVLAPGAASASPFYFNT